MSTESIRGLFKDKNAADDIPPIEVEGIPDANLNIWNKIM
jgi:hypothetical protein